MLVFFQRYYDMLVIKRVVMPVPFSLMDYWINIGRVGTFVTKFILAEKKNPWEVEGDGLQMTDDGRRTTDSEFRPLAYRSNDPDRCDESENERRKP